MWTLLLLLVQPVYGLEWYDLTSGRCTDSGRYATFEECQEEYGLTIQQMFRSSLPSGCYDTSNGDQWITGSGNGKCSDEYVCHCVMLEDTAECSDITTPKEYIDAQCCGC